MCSVLPAYHCVTGCDTTSYLANISKVRPFQNDRKANISFFEKSRKSYQLLSYNYIFWFTSIEYYWNSSSHVSKAKDQDEFNSFIWGGKHCSTFEEKWFAMFYMKAMYEEEYDYT